MRKAILILALLGAGLFAGAFVLSFVNPLLVERAARELIRIEVEKRVGEKLDTLSGSRLVGLAQRKLGRTDAEIERTRQAIRDDVPRRVADVVANMLDADCACRERLRAAARAAEGEHLGSLLRMREQLAALIESAYASVQASLLREFRIFTGTNAVAFALLALVTFVRKGATLQLLLPALVLVGAVAVAGGLYLFGQDWLHAIVFGDYVGWGYAALLSGVALLFADILLNHARISTHLVNAAGSVLGVAVHAVPC